MNDYKILKLRISENHTLINCDETDDNFNREVAPDNIPNYYNCILLDISILPDQEKSIENIEMITKNSNYMFDVGSKNITLYINVTQDYKCRKYMYNSWLDVDKKFRNEGWDNNYYDYDYYGINELVYPCIIKSDTDLLQHPDFFVMKLVVLIPGYAYIATKRETMTKSAISKTK